MKIIPKFQQGGYSSFFTVFKPVQTQGSTATTKPASSTPQTTTKSDDDKITQKQLFDMIKEIDGLDNDMTLIASNLLNAFEMAELTGNASDISKMYMSSLIKMKIANTNKKEFYKTTDMARINGSINQPAISADGKSLVLQNKETGKIVEMSYKDYASNKDNYYMLTNSNLAYLRQKDPQYAFNNSILNILNNGVSFKVFQESVDKAKNALGTSTLEYNGLIDTRSQESALKGLQVLKGLSEDSMIQASGSITTQGLYSYKQLDKTQKEQINALMTYMKRVLPDNLKTWAQVQTGMVDENQALEALLIPYLISGVSPEHQFTVNQVKLTKGSSGDGSGGSSDEPDATFLTSLQAGTGGSREKRSLILGGNAKSTFTGTFYGSVLGLDENVIYNTNLEDFLNKSGISGISNSTSVTFGDNIISSTLFPYIAVENNGGFLVVLPCEKHNNQTVPDFDLMKKFNEVVNTVIEEAGPNATLEEREKLLEKKLAEDEELEILLDMSGKLDSNRFASFFIVDGLASDKNINFVTQTEQNQVVPISDSSSLFIRPTNDQDKINFFTKITGIEQDPYDSLIGDLFGAYDTLYQGNIFIPVHTTNRLSAIIFSGQKIKESSAMKINTEYLESSTNMKNSSTDLLGL